MMMLMKKTAAAMMMIVALLVVVVHASTTTTTTTTAGRLRGQNQQPQQRRMVMRQLEGELVEDDNTTHERELLLAIPKIKNNDKNDDSSGGTTNSNQKVVVAQEVVASMMKAENAKRKDDNQKIMAMKKKKKEAKSQKNQQKQNQQQQQQPQNQPQNDKTSTASTKATATTTTNGATTTATTAKTTITTGNTSVIPNVGMLPIKCTISSSSSSSSTCPAQHFCKIDLGTCASLSSTNPTSSSSSSSSNTKMLHYYGTCQPQPTECSRKLDPVCGCDGVSYNSECIAHSVGVSVSSMGNCPKTNTGGGGGGGDVIVPNIGTLPTKCTTSTTLDDNDNNNTKITSTSSCPENQFCQVGDAQSCSTTSAALLSGTCQPKPMLCTLMYSPVCGCDHRTYSSACAAHGAGTSVWYEGECGSSSTPPMTTTATTTATTTTTSTDNKDTPSIVTVLAPLPTKCTIDPSTATTATTTTCPSDQFCQLTTGACSDSTTSSTGAVAIAGTCQAKPSVCISVYNPVCGCDGHTYDSMCSAHGAGVSVSHTGECEDDATTITPPTLVDDKDVLYKLFEGPCTSDIQCAGGLVCHAHSSTCVCNELTNEGCPIAGQLCGIYPGLYCNGDNGGSSCLPACSCDYTSPFPAIFTDSETDGDATSNGCEVGEVCRMPCAMADASPSCFKSEIERDCRSGYVCIDGNGDGIINQNDGGKGCVEAESEVTTTTTATKATLATIGAPPIQVLPCRIAGHCRSPSGVCEPPVACIADPCLTASCAANYVCEANYCGGCHASCVLADS